MNNIQALILKYPGIEWIQRGGTFAGLQAVKDDGTGQAISDPDNMITKEEYNEAIAEYKIVAGWEYVRYKRNQLLKDSDYTMLKDYPTTVFEQEWTTYRQSLRDIPQDYDSPDEVVYPDKPE